MDLTSLDREFSRLVRIRAEWTCANCGRCFEDCPEELHCSHFHHRMHKSVRFDYDNCDALCWECHQYFDLHPAEHSNWKLAQLGPARFEALREKARQIVRLDRKSVRANFKNMSFQAA
jgi:uncharacterized Fe-S center protein